MIQRILSASLSPNTETDDVFTALQMMCTPWKWIGGEYPSAISDWFKKQFPEHTVYTSNSGRSSLYLLCKAFDIGQGDEVLIQSFTCVAVPNSILWNGATPVYVDIDNSLNLDTDDAQKKITKRTKAIIVQHTLGLPANMEKIVAFAKKNHIFLIEDCAHALGATYKGSKIGSFGDAAFFSFGRDKIVSSVFGGVGIIRSDRKDANAAMNELYSKLPRPRRTWVVQQLLHPVLFAIVIPLYTLGLGKILLVLFQKLSLLTFPVYPAEKNGDRPSDFPSSYPNALAKLLILQLSKLDRYNKRRKHIAALYAKELQRIPSVSLLSYPEDSIYLRFPLTVADPEAVVKKAKKSGILLGNWYHNTIDPTGVDFTKIGYKPESCPNAHRLAAGILNLPTNITDGEARRVIDVFL